jgi:hypothetical protein
MEHCKATWKEHWEQKKVNEVNGENEDGDFKS